MEEGERGAWDGMGIERVMMEDGERETDEGRREMRMMMRNNGK